MIRAKNSMIVDTDARLLGNNRGPQPVCGVMNILAFGIGNLGWPGSIAHSPYRARLVRREKVALPGADLGESMNELRKAREDIDRKLHKAVAKPPPYDSTQQLASGPSIHQVTP